MGALSGSRGDTHDVGTFLSAWGDLLGVLLGIAIALALWPVMDNFVLLIHSALVALGMTADAATVALYWLGMFAIGAGFLVAFNGPDVRVDRLRAAGSEWAALLLVALTAAGATALWLTAAATWASYEDEFNTYEAGTELPAVGLAVVMIAGAVVLRWTRRRRRSAESQQPS